MLKRLEALDGGTVIYIVGQGNGVMEGDVYALACGGHLGVSRKLHMLS